MALLRSRGSLPFQPRVAVDKVEVEWVIAKLCTTHNISAGAATQEMVTQTFIRSMEFFRVANLHGAHRSDEYRAFLSRLLNKKMTPRTPITPEMVADCVQNFQELPEHKRPAPQVTHVTITHSNSATLPPYCCAAATRPIKSPVSSASFRKAPSFFDKSLAGASYSSTPPSASSITFS